MSQPATLPELIEARAQQPELLFLTQLDLREGRQDLTTTQLWNRALSAAAGLRAQGLQPGDRLMLLLPNGVPFVETLFGALLAGVVPVIYPAPHTARVLHRYLAQLGRILEQCRPWGAVLDEQTLQSAGSFEGIRLIGPPRAEAPLAEIHRPSPEDPAIIQYSSGSTGDPKGVVLPHRSILANGRAIGRAIDSTDQDIMLSWLPLCHDMGLFGGLLFAWLHGWRAVHLKPHDFLVDPALWLQTISQYRATITIAPNFAYSLCLHGVEDEQMEGVDLSSLRVAFNGAEPISRRATEGFLDRFQSWGFRREALFPVYGMAENTLANAFPPVGRGPRFDSVLRSTLELEGKAVPADLDTPVEEVKDIASVGRPIDGVELCILDEKDEPVAERVEGEIGLRGTSLQTEYLNNPTTTARIMRNGWLHTGDQGYLAGGELHVTGRKSDLIIRAGRNLHPQDLEAVVEPLEGVRRGCVVAGGLRDSTDGTEEIVVLAETKLAANDTVGQEALRATIRTSLLETLGIAPERIVLLGPRALPKTSSGKLQRRLALRLLESGQLPLLHS